MKIAMVSYGPLGDILPFQALGKALLQAGHQVRMCSHDIFATRFRETGIDYVSIGPPFDRDYYNETLDRELEIKDPVQSLLFLIERGILADAKQWYEDALKGLDGWELAIIHAVDIPAEEAAIKLNIPWITVSLCPGDLRTSYEPPMPMPNICRFTNWCFWELVKKMCSKRYDAPFNKFLASIGGKPRTNIALDSTYSHELTLVAASPALCNEYPDRPPYFKFTGPWFYEDESYKLPEELLNFLKNGDPPIVISFSSIGGTHGQQIANLIQNVVQKLGVRAILQRGWLEMSTDKQDPHIFHSSYIPHTYLFKHAALVVHHGGAGTTQTACSTGALSVIVPFIADEFYWGILLHEKGLSPKMIPQNKLTEAILKKTLEKALSNPIYRNNADKMQIAMSKENGLACALKYIEQFAKQKKIL